MLMKGNGVSDLRGRTEHDWTTDGTATASRSGTGLSIGGTLWVSM